MRSTGILSAMLIFVCTIAAATAQESENRETPEIESVMTHIPAGSMGYAAVHSIDDSIERVEAWLTDTGLGKITMGGGEGYLLNMMLEKFSLNEGFNTSGGAAIVMLDAKKFDIDLPAMILHETKKNKDGWREAEFTVSSTQPEDEDSETQPDEVSNTQADEESDIQVGEESETQPAATKADETKTIKLPYVIFLPGNSPEEIFNKENATITQEGKYQKLVFADGDELLAGRIGSYVILSPLAGALDMVIASKKNSLEELGRDKADLVMDGGIVCHINMTLSAPTINAGMEAMKDSDSFGSMYVFMPFLIPFKAMAEMSPFYTYAFSQMETFTFTGKAGETGLLANILVDWKPDSLFAKIYEANSGPVGELLDKVPNVGYFFAIGATLERGKEAGEITLKRVDALLANKHISPHVSKEMKERVEKLSLDMHKQVDKWQLVYGGGPNDNGMMSMGAVLHCQDAEKTKELLVQSTALIEELVDNIRTKKDFSSSADSGENGDETASSQETEENTEGADEAVDPNKLRIVYTEAAETSGELKIDTIEIRHSSLDQFAGMSPSPLTMYLGEDKLCIRLASPDKNTLVLTFGGGTDMMTEALKAVEAKTPLLTEEQAAEIFEHLPKNCSTVALLNPGCYFTMMMKMMSMYGDGGKTTIPDFSHLTPVAFGSAAIGKTKHGVIYVPNKMIKEIISSINSMHQMEEHGGPPIEEGEDF